MTPILNAGHLICNMRHDPRKSFGNGWIFLWFFKTMQWWNGGNIPWGNGCIMMSWCITSWGNEISKRRGRSGCQRFCRSRVTTGRQEADLWSLPWVKVDGSFRFIQGTLFRSLRIAALRVLRLPRFLELFQCSKIQDDKTKEAKSAHFWMLIGSCCQPYQNLPIKIFISHPSQMHVFAGFVHLHFSTFVVFFLQANCHKCYRSCKLRSRCTVRKAVIVWRTSKKKVHST